MSEQLVRSILAAAAANCWSALDVGSGPGKYRAPVKQWLTIDPSCDVVTSDFHWKNQALHVLPMLLDRDYDLVYALDVIEHLEKADGRRLLNELERVARRRVLIFTPNGFQPQEDENPWNVHRSGWTPDDFRRRGYVTATMDFDYGKGLQPNAALWAILKKQS